MAVIVPLPARWGVEELADARPLGGRADLEDPADLGRQQIGVPALAAQETVEPGLRKPEPVERCGVEVATAGRPGFVKQAPGIVIADCPVEIAERRRAEAQLGKVEAAILMPLPVPNAHHSSES
jgi:hypothetical protein